MLSRRGWQVKVQTLPLNTSVQDGIENAADVAFVYAMCDEGYLQHGGGTSPFKPLAGDSSVGLMKLRRLNGQMGPQTTPPICYCSPTTADFTQYQWRVVWIEVSAAFCDCEIKNQLQSFCRE